MIIGMTGASGSVFGIRLLEALKESDVETHVIASKWAQRTMEHETSLTVENLRDLADVYYGPGDMGAQISSGSFITEGSGSYAIKDIATDEYIVPFSGYTSMSCDSEGPYFNQWLDGFYPDRVYKILLKLKYNDGQEQTFDDDFEFVVKRS